MVSTKDKDTKSKKSSPVVSDEKPKKVKSDTKSKSASSKIASDSKEKPAKASKEKAVLKESVGSSSKSKDKDRDKAVAPAKPPPSKKAPKKAAAPEPSDDYLADLDLPPSDEEEYETTAARAEPEEEAKKPEVNLQLLSFSPITASSHSSAFHVVPLPSTHACPHLQLHPMCLLHHSVPGSVCTRACFCLEWWHEYIFVARKAQEQRKK